MAVAINTGNALRKLGADMRWFLEQNGVDAEKARVIICVENEGDERAMMQAMKKLFDPTVMEIDDGQVGVTAAFAVEPRRLSIFGVKFSLVRIAK